MSILPEMFTHSINSLDGYNIQVFFSNFDSFFIYLIFQTLIFHIRFADQCWSDAANTGWKTLLDPFGDY